MNNIKNKSINLHNKQIEKNELCSALIIFDQSVAMRMIKSDGHNKYTYAICTRIC